MKKCLILGGGVSGIAAERLALKLGYETEIRSDAPGVDAAKAVAGRDLIVASPGVKPLSSPLWQAAAQSGIEFIGEMEFGFRHWPGKVLAVTGTNGKTTTTELTVALLRSVGVDARPAGNIGFPLSGLAAAETDPAILAVLEVSSFQLELCRDFAPQAAVLLNLASDHEDRYAGGFAEYAAVKQRIFDQVKKENRIYGLSMESPMSRRVTFYGEAMFVDGEVLIDVGNTALSAPHNRENLAAAVELCLRVLSPEQVLSPEFRLAIHLFQPGRHRQELLYEEAGVRFINDSKATNPASTVAALEAIPGRVVLLLGGLDKGMDFAPIVRYADKIRLAVLYGECREKIAAALQEEIAFVDCGNDFERAVKTAKEAAEQGDTVLLAPACASMDMFKDYQERGDRFAELVKKA